MNEIDQFTKRHRKDSKEGSPPLSEELIKGLFDLVCYDNDVDDDDVVDDDNDNDDDDYDNYDTDY